MRSLAIPHHNINQPPRHINHFLHSRLTDKRSHARIAQRQHANVALTCIRSNLDSLAYLAVDLYDPRKSLIVRHPLVSDPPLLPIYPTATPCHSPPSLLTT